MANDIVNINVAETVETVAITVNPNLTTVNINRQVPVGVNGQDLQSVTDIGSVTTNSITANSFIKSGGTSNQFLKANGTVDSSVYTTAQNLQSVTNLGATTTNTIIANVASSNPANPAITGYSTTGAGVYGQSDGKGVFGYSFLDTAVYGLAESANGIGVKGYAEDGVGAEFETDATNVNTNIVNFKKSGVLKASVGNGGDITANSFVKTGGTATQILAANGSVITAGTNITISSGTISSTGGGGGGATNLTTSQTASNFTINSDTGTDASIPLGNGTLAGATLNDYTSAEKTKLAGIEAGANLGVPYTGATSDVNLGEFGIQLGNLEFDNTPTNIPTTAGSMYYNDADGTLDLILKGGNVKLQIGQESVVRVVNKTSTNIDLLEANYQAVRITGAQGQRMKVDLAQATNDVLSSETIGLVTETIANNAEGFVTTSGIVRGINTTGSLQSETWADGDILYLSPTVAGQITKVKPTAPNHLIIIGYVIYAHITQGTIFVKVDNGYELDELHNVKIDAVTNNEVLAYTSATDIWENKTPSEAGLQPTLVSATNIKTINGNTLLGSGDLVISGTGISSLNGLTGATQTFSILTNVSGSPSFSSTGTNHQLRLPTASSGVDYGLVTNGSQNFGGTKIFVSNPEIPVPAGNSGTCIVLGTTGGGGATGTLQIGSTTNYPNGVEMQYVKGITSSVQTQLNGKASELDVAEQTYSLSPTFTGTAPTIISSSTYQWNKVGTLVTGRVNLIYTTAGSISQVVIPLPTDMPTPLSPTGLGSALDILYYGVGMFSTLTTTVSNVSRTCILRRNAANTGYEFVITHSAAISSRVISLTLQYFT